MYISLQHECQFRTFPVCIFMDIVGEIKFLINVYVSQLPGIKKKKNFFQFKLTFFV